MDKVNAQQARRLLDRIVGYKLSPLISSKIQKGLSAGRVQSSSLKIVVDREREIKAFVPQEYYTIDAMFEKEIEAKLVEFEKEKIDKLTVNSGDFANRIVTKIKNEKFTVAEIEKKKRTTSTPPPFMTSTLQQTASSKLGFSPRKTMMVAQSLYEGVKTGQGVSGLITYMRTDSLNLAPEAVSAARDAIMERYGEKYLPSKPKVYTTKSKSAQEAHEAIRPTMIDFTPQMAGQYLKNDDLRLYTLIYNRFMASQMENAQFESQNIIFRSESSLFKANGRKLVFDGFYRVMGDADKDKLLPELKKGQDASVDKLEANQHFTEPPPRYSEASLIKTLESMGIGRPSTYAPTISLLQSRDYIKLENKQLVPSEVAFNVTEVLENHFTEIVDSGFTANMEGILDEIAENKQDWQKVLIDFYTPFMEKITEGKASIKSQKIAIPTGEMCPECGEELVRRKGRFGEFVACSGYPKCKYTKPNEGESPKVRESDQMCDKCGSPMVIKSGRNGEFLACSGYPKCKNTKPLNQKKAAAPCPECGGEVVQRRSRKGTFYGCSNYPKCKFISNFEPIDRKCSECNYVMVARTYRNKDVYECIKCKHREPREDGAKEEEASN